MVREVITVQVGQCGNQIGCRFWDLALREHAAFQRGTGTFDESMSSFFRNVDARRSPAAEIGLGDGTRPISSLRARAVLVDMEEGVVSQVLRSPLAELFDRSSILTDVSGAGNNWAHGHDEYGPMHRDGLLERVRRAAEPCDSLQCFSLIYSMGGGTGSGLGSYTLHALADDFPAVTRITTAVFPSATDDVITSPYNSVLAANALLQHSDVAIPVDNAALASMVRRAEGAPPHSTAATGGLGGSAEGVRPDSLASNGGGRSVVGSGGGGSGGGSSRRARAFDGMNNLVAHALCGLTASVRFPGALNTDLADLTSNLVPFPKMHFLLPALAPLYSAATARYQPAKLDTLISEGLAPHSQLTTSDPRRHRYLACGLLLRGDATASDAHRALSQAKPQLSLPWWNPDAFKLGLCTAPPVGQPHALLALSNNCATAGILEAMVGRFDQLYRRGAHVHHFTRYMDSSRFDEAREGLCGLIDAYRGVQHLEPSPHAQELMAQLAPPPARAAR